MAFILLSANTFNLDQSRILSFCIDLTKPFENIGGKGGNAGNQHFLLFPQCFPPNERLKSSFELHLFCCLHMLSMSWLHFTWKLVGDGRGSMEKALNRTHVTLETENIFSLQF